MDYTTDMQLMGLLYGNTEYRCVGNTDNDLMIEAHGMVMGGERAGREGESMSSMSV